MPQPDHRIPRVPPSPEVLAEIERDAIQRIYTTAFEVVAENQLWPDTPVWRCVTKILDGLGLALDALGGPRDFGLD